MTIRASYHRDYITLLPSISIGRGWMMIDWLWWVVDITKGEIPF